MELCLGGGLGAGTESRGRGMQLPASTPRQSPIHTLALCLSDGNTTCFSIHLQSKRRNTLIE